MIYYHGTSPENLAAILRFGLLPDRPTTYTGEEVPYGGVYLAESLRYAVEMGRRGNEIVGIVEVEVLDLGLLLLDEDDIPISAYSYLSKFGLTPQAWEGYAEYLLDELIGDEDKLVGLWKDDVYLLAKKIVTRLSHVVENYDMSRREIFDFESSDPAIRGWRNELTAVIPVELSCVNSVRTLNPITVEGPDPIITGVYKMRFTRQALEVDVVFGHADPATVKELYFKRRPQIDCGWEEEEEEEEDH